MTQRRSVLLAAAWMVGAIVSFSATALAVRALARSFATFEILTMRSLAGIAILLAFALVRPAYRGELRMRRPGLQILRNLVHATGTYAWTKGVVLLPLATVFALEFTSPLWVAALAVPTLGERLTRTRVLALAMGFAGVLVILRPGAGSADPAVLLVLYAALAFAVTAILTKRMTATMSTFTILFWMNVVQLPLNAAGAAPDFWRRLDPGHALPLLGLAVCGLFSHFCLTNAYRHGDASMVVTLDFLRIPLIAVLGWQLYGEAFDPLVLVGSALIVAGILWNLRHEARRPRMPA